MIDTQTVVLIVFPVFLALLAWGVPIGIALGLMGVVGTILFTGNVYVGCDVATEVSFEVASKYSYMVLPMFVLMGILASDIGISKDLFDSMYKLIGWLPGGLAIATNVACAGFAAVTGSSMSATVAMGKIALPEMERFKYKPVLSTAVVASAGTFAIMIPPSIMLVIYAIFTMQSIGKLLLAGLIPGLITAVVYSLQIAIRARLDPTLGPPGPSFPWRDKVRSLTRTGPFVTIILVILGGILFGLWTPTEAAAGGVVLVFCMGFLKKGSLTKGKLVGALKESTIISATVFLVIIGSIIFGRFLAISGMTDQITLAIAKMQFPPWAMFSLMVIFFIFLGTFLEGISMLALIIPLILPVIQALGWNLVWFGVIFVKLVEIAQVTPPVGLNLYAVKSIAPDVSIGTIYMGCIPFWLCDVIVLVLLFLFPEIVLWLPNMVMV